MANLLDQAEEQSQPQKEALILRRLPPSLSIDSAQTPTTRPLTLQEQDSLALLNRLKEFLATAPTRWSPSDAPGTVPFPNPQKHPALNRFALPSGEYVTCVLWNGLYHITGTDIVRAMVYRFEAFGRPVRNMKKFEEGIFSDLRNLKPGADACLEEPKSPFLDLLYKYQCIRTQKKQKVFYWFSVPHDRLFLDALERDLKREKISLEPATSLVGEPALSFKYDGSSGKSLWEEWCAKVKGLKEEAGRNSLDDMIAHSAGIQDEDSGMGVINGVISGADRVVQSVTSEYTAARQDSKSSSAASTSSFGLNKLTLEPRQQQQFWGGMLELFEGSPSYKQRRKKRVPGQARVKDVKDRGRGVRKGSKDPEDEMDSSVGVTPTLSPITQSVSEPGRQRVGNQGEIELARKELQETLAHGLPPAADSPASVHLSESRSASDSPEQESDINDSSLDIIDPIPAPVRSASFGGTSPQALLKPSQHQLHAHGVNPRLYHPYYNNHPTQHRHTLPIQVVESSRPSSSHRASPSRLVPHHAQTLPPNIRFSDASSSSPVIAFFCPLQQCRRLFNHPDMWKGHIEQHHIEGTLPSLDMRAALSFRVTLPAGSQVEEVPSQMDDSELHDPQNEHRHTQTPPIQVENAHFAYAPPDRGPAAFVGAQPTTSLSVSPVPWQGGRPLSAGYASSPGSTYSGPPSSHSPSPPNEVAAPNPQVGLAMRGTLDIPRAQAYSSLTLPNHGGAQQAMSAPSYRHSFDHASMYPQGLSPSPVRITRPRSAVPQMTREEEEIASRPNTSVSYNGGPGYFHSPAQDSPVVNFSPYPPSSATSSNFPLSAEDHLGISRSTLSGSPVVAIYKSEPYQEQVSVVEDHLGVSRNNSSSSPVLTMYKSEPYQEQLPDIVTYNRSPERSVSLDYEETPDMEMESTYPHRDHLGTTGVQDPHIVGLHSESELEYPPSEQSPPDLWNTNYNSNPDIAKEAYTHVPIVTVDPVTGMTPEEAIQLFS